MTMSLSAVKSMDIYFMQVSTSAHLQYILRDDNASLKMSFLAFNKCGAFISVLEIIQNVQLNKSVFQKITQTKIHCTPLSSGNFV